MHILHAYSIVKNYTIYQPKKGKRTQALCSFHKKLLISKLGTSACCHARTSGSFPQSREEAWVKPKRPSPVRFCLYPLCLVYSNIAQSKCYNLMIEAELQHSRTFKEKQIIPKELGKKTKANTKTPELTTPTTPNQAKKMESSSPSVRKFLEHFFKGA